MGILSRIPVRDLQAMKIDGKCIVLPAARTGSLKDGPYISLLSRKHKEHQSQVVVDRCLRQGIYNIVKVGVDVQPCSEEYLIYGHEVFVICIMGEVFGDGSSILSWPWLTDARIIESTAHRYLFENATVS